MWQEEYNKLSHSDKEEFSRIVNLLLVKTFVLRDKYSSKDQSSKINHDYRFIERNYDLIRIYLKISGWELQKDNNYGVIALYNYYDLNRTRVDKNTTTMLYLLRLIYEEEREKLSLKKEVLIKVSSVLEKMFSLGLVSRKPSNKDLAEAFTFLRRFNIIDKINGDFTDPDATIIIYPSILFIVPNDKLSEIYDMTQEDEVEADLEDEELAEE